MSKKRATKLLKIFNPIIWLINVMTYFGYMDMMRGHKYEPYNFAKFDIKYW